MQEHIQNSIFKIHTLPQRKKALVIGCSGQDGSLLCKSLLKNKYSVIGLTRNPKKELKTHVLLGIAKDLELKKCDLTNYQKLRNIISNETPTEIYNLAAQSSVGKSFYSPKETTESIVNGTLNILEACREINYCGKLFFAGSSEIFGNTLTRATISHPQNPNSPYAVAKQHSFQLVKLYRKVYKLKCVTGILFNHESPFRGNNFITQKIISGAINASKNKSHQIQIGNINIARDWGWADEYVEAMQLITRSKELKDHIICTGKLTSLIQFIDIAYSNLNLNWQDHITIDNSLKRTNDIEKSFGNPNPLEKDLQWKANLKIEEIINRMIEYKLNLK